MPDDKSKAGGQDRRRINVDEDYELRDFGVTQEELKAAVRFVGDQASAVEKHHKARPARYHPRIGDAKPTAG
jgi:hypothetical protein